MITLAALPSSLGRDSPKRRAARAALMAVLWDPKGRRRLPAERVLAAALEACDVRDVWWVCEATSAGPVYLLPTREWIRELARTLDALGAKTVLEVAAGDGFLSACLQKARPKLRIHTTDDYSWTKPQARQSAADRREFKGVQFSGIAAGDVEKLGAVAAVKRYRPDVVLVSWAPPGTLVERVIRAPSKWVLDISVDGDVCGNGMRTWRFEKDFLDGPLEEKALCRLDARPSSGRQTQVTLYYGRRHRQHAVHKM